MKTLSSKVRSQEETIALKNDEINEVKALLAHAQTVIQDVMAGGK